MRRLEVEYTNYKGSTNIREIVPERMYWGQTEYLKTPQWIVKAFDITKEEFRDFALKDMKILKYFNFDNEKHE